MRSKLSDGSSYFFHLQKLEGFWERPQGFVQNSTCLTHDEIQVRSTQLQDELLLTIRALGK